MFNTGERPSGTIGLAARLAGLLMLSTLGWAQLPFNQMNPEHRALAQTIFQKADFTFETQTPPTRVRLAVMEKLFDRPRLAAAMWRHCQFVPSLFANEPQGEKLVIDDAHGLRGSLALAYRQPGLRVYLIEGRVETGRMNNPFPVGAKMVVIYRYWEGPKGFESHLQTWTTLDSALLAFLSKPWRKYIQRRQQEFIAYINFNIAQGGAFADLHPLEFRAPLRQEGDPIAIRQFDEVFGK